MRKKLALHEELLLLALKDKKGTFVSAGTLDYAIGGAMLSELLLQKKIEVDEVKKKKRLINLVNNSRTGDPVLDECLKKLNDAKRRANMKTWVQRLGRIKKLKHRIAKELCRKNILRQDEDKVLLIFTRKIYPEIDPRPEDELIERMREAIFTDKKDIDPRTAIIIALAKNVDLLKHAFDKKKLKTRKTRLKEIAEGQATAKAAKEAIEAMQAAVFVAVIVPAIATAGSN